MKIIFVCSKPITFNTFLKSQANYLTQKGLNIEVASSESKKLNFNNNLKHKINFPYKISQLFNLVNYIKIFKQIKKLVRSNPEAIFYLHTPIASHFFRFFTFSYKLKIIYFVHGFRFTSKTSLIKAFFFKIIEKILSFKTDIFITINKEDFNYSKLNLSKRNSCYKINGVGLDLSKNHIYKKMKNKKGIKEILVIAAYKKDKGYFEVLKVAEMLKDNSLKIDCFGYGDFNEFNSIKIKNKINNISFNKFDKKLKDKINKYDILLHLSKREGLPVSVMQCLSKGLPVICFNIRGNNDLVKDKFNGLFVETFKDVPKKIFYLNLEKKFFYQLKINAIKSINKNFFEKHINSKLYKIIKDFNKNYK